MAAILQIRQPSWLSEQNGFSNSESQCGSDAWLPGDQLDQVLGIFQKQQAVFAFMKIQLQLSLHLGKICR